MVLINVIIVLEKRRGSNRNNSSNDNSDNSDDNNKNNNNSNKLIYLSHQVILCSSLPQAINEPDGAGDDACTDRGRKSLMSFG